MKNMLMYYYNINNLNYYKQNDNIFFDEYNNIYILEVVYNKNEIYNIYKFIEKDPKFYKILHNINNDLITNIYGINYIFMRKNDNKPSLYDSITNNKKILINNSISKPLWNKLWATKIDYYEYQLAHIVGNYKLIDESINYYIGLSENAISYLKYNLTNDYSLDLVLSHKRIEENNYYNPLNLTVDYRARDVAGYLKFLFFQRKYHNFDFLSFFYKLNFNYNEYIMTFSRVIFPSFYFDVYDKIINKNENEIILLELLKRVDEYEDYIKMVYIEINKVFKIPKLDWL